ncbi:LysR substrate-binding domain-containing protein [Sphingobium sp. V4]|nr:LysR substrate-binding domain-containing protein [Sphingobium sp. V4]WIW89446.1 LysR substrate-binding domain-containing protein [Sphingobium sp. V4]
MRSAGSLYAWELEKGGEQLRIRMNGPLIFDNAKMVLEAALAGFGLAFVLEDQVAPYLASGALKQILADWTQPFPGYHLYYPSRRQPSAAFALFVDRLRLRN